MTIGIIESIVLNRLPKFLRGLNWGRFLKSYAAALDGVNEALRQGLVANNPILCDRVDLPTVAKDRALKIPPAMPEQGTRDMLASWLQLHRGRASSEGVLRHVRNYFAPGPYPSMQIVHENGVSAEWHKLDSAGRYTITRVTPTNFVYDGATGWATWHIIIEDADDDGTPIPVFDLANQWGDSSTWGGGPIWGGFSSQTAADLYSLAVDWKRAGTRLQSVILNRQPGSIGPATVLITDADGWTTLPSGGNWGGPVYTSGPYFGHNTRPHYLKWLYDRGF